MYTCDYTCIYVSRQEMWDIRNTDLDGLLSMISSSLTELICTDLFSDLILCLFNKYLQPDTVVIRFFSAAFLIIGEGGW